MKQTTELDLGPLTWVKSEIDLALARADEALTKARTSSEALTHVQFAQTHLHQACGALSIVGLDGVTHFASSVERLLGAITRGDTAADDTALDIAGRALAAIGNYLEELVRGTPDQPMRLSPLYAEIAAARGLNDASPADLFYPDLSRRLPRPLAGAKALSPDWQDELRRTRSKFERGLLLWLKNGHDINGPAGMREACIEIEDMLDGATPATLWWVAQAFFDALAHGDVDDAARAKKICTQLAKELRQLQPGAGTTPDALMREILYVIAICPAKTARQTAVREVWELDALIPEPGSTVTEIPLAPLLKVLHAELATSKRAWDEFCVGQAVALPRFMAHLSQLASDAKQLGRPALDRLLTGICDFTTWLRQDPLVFQDAIAIEVATALLLAEVSLDRGVPESGFTAQVDDTLSRLSALSRGEDVPSAEGSATVSTARKLHEKQARIQVSREILSNLAQVEQALDDFFRNQAKRAPLAGLAGPLKQIEGALSLIGEEQAISLVRESAQTVDRLANTTAEPAPGEFETLAQRLSALGFYIDALQHGAANLNTFLHPDAAVQVGNVESHREPAIRDAQADVAADAAAPTATTQPQSALGDAATSLTDTPSSALQADRSEEPAVLSSSADTAAHIDSDTSPVVTASGAESESDAESIDVELLEIFLEEADEVLATIDAQLAMVRTDDAGLEPLTAIRRAFHTLKGSGRMVGLTELGEAAWGIEQTLNRWLQLDWMPTAELTALLASAHQTFAAWAAQIAAGHGHSYDATALMREALRLRETDSEEHTLATEDFQLTSLDAIDLEAPEDLEASDLETTDLEATDLEGINFESIDFEPADQDTHQLENQDLAAPELDSFLPAETSLDPLGYAEDALDDVAEQSTPEHVSDTKQEDLLPEEISLDALDPFDESGFFEPDFLDTSVMPEALSPLEERPGADDLSQTDLAQTTPQDSREESFDADATDNESTDDTQPDLEAELPSPVLDFGDLASPEFEDLEPGDEIELESELESELEPELQLEPEPELEPEAESEPETEQSVASDDDSDVRIGDTEISRTLFDLYLAEGETHLETLNSGFGNLRRNPTLQPSDTTLRAAHTLAGISGTARITPIQTLARALEHAQERLIDLDAEPTVTQVELLCLTAANLETMFTAVARRCMPLAAPELEAQLDALGRAPERAEETTLDIAAAHGEVEPHPAPIEHSAPEPEPEPSPAVHDDLDEQLLPIFMAEGSELLGELHAVLRTWQDAPDDTTHATATARLLHTLKGSARMAGAMRIGEMVHQLESRLDTAHKADRITPPVLDELVAGLDAVQLMLETLGQAQGAPAPTAFAAAATPGAPSEPSVAASDSASEVPTLRVRADKVDRFVNEAGEIGIARTRIEGELRTVRRSLLDLTENVIRLRNQLREVEIQAEVQMQTRMAQAESRHADFDPLEMDRFTRLQELTRLMAESVGDVTTVQQNLLRNLDGAEIALNSQARMSRDLQQGLMKVRMVPFDSLADRLHRIVRQSAKDLGKRVNLDIQGGRIELDRGVLERMTAALEHLLRNAVAHGIESPDARDRAGKNVIGQITLSMRQEGNEIAITLADDGVGLDHDAIAIKARNKGLIGADEVIDERRLTNLIFVPGFSTASTLSAVSGRGVGMDVVKSETASVGGRIDVQSVKGQGTEFRIYLPLTLAVTQAVLVRAAQQSYAIPSSMIAQVMELKAGALEQVIADGGVDWQGQHFAYRYLPHLLGEHSFDAEKQRFNWLLLLHAGAQTLALHVDALRGNQEIVVKNAGPQLVRIVGITGATVLGDGEIVLILNPVALASRSLDTGYAAALQQIADQTPATAPPHQPSVLIVDDSLTVRKITGRLLEREGYQVVTAKDGTDALEKLLDWLPDVILSDIEMPRMDGFDLVRNLRADARTEAIPVIMITSRLAEKHREYALKVGANHYLGKPFDEDELLGLLQRYTAAPALTH